MRSLPIAPFRMTWHRDVPDAAIAWAMHLHQSRGQVERCLQNLRTSHPYSRVVLISDGDGDDYGDIARTLGCDLVEGAHMHALATCHLYVIRILEALSAGDETYCFKIDPDTAVWRRFRALPAFSCLFGTLETLTEGRLADVDGPPNVQGGCIGMTADAVRAILAAGVLNEKNCVEHWRTTWARCADMQRAGERGQFCDDFVISWAADQIGLPLLAHPEIRSRWRREAPSRRGEWAVTHPHKTGRVLVSN
ncbi:MAG: hypothetical protein ABS36_16995 [Acidobacteria bacterium SCN 69-37]|nr:MAG: hypothetical protein ABS36_16995 [Acidobacteria bacterium SCN 69-37]